MQPARVRAASSRNGAAWLAVAASVATWGLMATPAMAADAPGGQPPGGDARPWTVCMSGDNPPLSASHGPGRWGKGLKGLDVTIAEAAAAAMGRPLRLMPFDTSYEKESTLVHEVSALLASGRCDAISGFPLLHGDIGAPTRPNAREPDYPDAPRKPKRPFITLQATAASTPYIGAALGLVSRVDGERAGPPASLAELTRGNTQTPPAADRVGVTAGTVAGTYGMLWRNGALKRRLVTVGQREEVLDGLNAPSPAYGHVLVPLARYDGWRLNHADAPVAVSPWRKPLGINLGFLLPASHTAEKAALDRTIGQALADGRLARWAQDAGVSWSPPTEPAVSGGLGLAALLAD